MLHADEMRPEALLATALANDPGSDAAVGRLAAPGDEALVIAIDTLVSGIHFQAQAKSEDVAYKAVAVNLSDLAAMGATPLSLAVSVTAEKLSGAWIEGFRRGLAQTARGFGIEVAVAGLARGPLIVSVEAVGRVPPGAALRRNGARPGDRIYVTGTLGDAGLGLMVAQGEVSLPPEDAAFVLLRLHRPQPRIAAGVALRGLASSAIDVSDGLVGDLGHILDQSGVGATVQVERLPLSPVVKSHPPGDSALELASSFGDDYELCFTLPDSAMAKRLKLGCAVTEIGVIDEQRGLRFCRDDGRPFLPRAAYSHFRT